MERVLRNITREEQFVAGPVGPLWKICVVFSAPLGLWGK